MLIPQELQLSRNYCPGFYDIYYLEIHVNFAP